MKKRVLSLLIVFAMIVSMLPIGTLAAGSGSGNEKDKLIYVSIGDSMTNGYGNDGYDGSSGIVNYANNTYANLFAAWLAGYTGEIADDQVIFEGANGIVDHRQLAMSGMRAEDIHWLLELDHSDAELIEKVVRSYQDEWNNVPSWTDEIKDKWFGEFGFKTGDYRTRADLADTNYRLADGAAKILAIYHGALKEEGYFTSSYSTEDMVAYAIAGVERNAYYPDSYQDRVVEMGFYKYLQISAEFYQKSVADADVISLALGNTNFGTYMLNEIMDVVMNNDDSFAKNYDINDVYALADLDPAVEAEVKKLVDKYDDIIDELFGSLANGDETKLERLKYIITYCVTSFAVNYIGTVDAILALNPDAKIIQVALMNAYADEDSGIEGITLGNMVDIMYTPVNAFIAALPTAMQVTGNELYKDATFYYAEADSVGCMVDVFGDDFYKENGQYIKYPGMLNGTEGYEANLKSTVRDRFFEEIFRGQTFDMMVGAGIISNADRNGVALADVVAYDQMTPAQKAAFAARNSGKAKAFALYLSFENAHIQAGRGTVTMDSLAALGGLSTSTFAGAMTELATKAPEAGKAYLDAAALVVAAGSGGALNADAVKALCAGGDDAIYAYIASRSGGQLTAAQVKALYGAENHDAAIYGYVASLSNGYLDANGVKNLYLAVMAEETPEGQNDVVYGTIVTIANNPLLTVDVLRVLRSAPDMDVAIEAYIAGIVKTTMSADQQVQQVMAGTGHQTIDDVLACTNAYHGSYCGAVQSRYTSELQNAVNAYAPALKAAVAGFDQLWTAVNGVNQLKGVIGNVDSLKYAVASANSLCYLLCMPQVLSDAMVNDSTLSGILCMNARCLVGTGIGGHPSEAGHLSLYNAIKKTYEDEYTSQNKTLDTLLKLLKTYGPVYGPKILKNIWNQWETHYGADVKATIDALVKLIEERYGAYEDAADKIGAELEELLATKDALEAELVALKAQLAKKKVELEEVLAKQEIGSVTAPDINIEIDPDLGNNTQTTVPGNDCVVGDESVKTELEKAIADLEHAIAVLEALVSDISADIADMAKVAAEIGEAIAELGKTLEQLAAAGRDLAEAIAAVEDVLTNESGIATAEQIKKVFEIALAAAEEAADIIGVAKDMLPVLSEDISDAMDILVTDITALYEQILTDIPKAIEYHPEAKIVLGAILVLVNENKLTQEEAEALIEEKLTELKNSEEYKKAEQDLKNLKAEIELEITTRYEAAKEQLTAEANAKLAILNAKKAALEAEIADLKAQLAAAEGAVRETLQAQIDRITGDLAMVDADVAHINEHLKAALEIAYEEIVAEVNALYAEAVAALEAKIRELTGMALDELLKLGTETLNSLLETLKNKGEEAIIVVGNKLVELLNQMMDYATHGEVLAGLNLKYVALGDGSNDFAAVLADLLKGKAPANFEFVNAAKPGATVADVAANLPADVIGANVITLGFSQTEIIGKALSAFLNGEELNWTELVGADVAPYAAVALEYVYSEIDAMELDEKTAAMVKAIAEAYAYGVAEYAINLPVLIKNIREVNKTAEIVIVGMHNPLENLSIDLPIYGKIDLSAYGELFNYLVDGVYGYGVALSVIAKDVTYVDARDVEIEKNALGLKEVDALLKGDISALYPSANGDAYIAEQINNALTVKMLGDANDDGVVDSYDATLIARYDVGLIGASDLNLAVCDVNGDGVVDSYDATLVARYDVGLLAA